MTPNEAKKVVRDVLSECSIYNVKLSAKTVSFMDLARDSRIFVTIHGYSDIHSDALRDILDVECRKNGISWRGD